MRFIKLIFLSVVLYLAGTSVFLGYFVNRHIDNTVPVLVAIAKNSYFTGCVQQLIDKSNFLPCKEKAVEFGNALKRGLEN